MRYFNHWSRVFGGAGGFGGVVTTGGVVVGEGGVEAGARVPQAPARPLLASVALAAPLPQPKVAQCPSGYAQ